MLTGTSQSGAIAVIHDPSPVLVYSCTGTGTARKVYRDVSTRRLYRRYAWLRQRVPEYIGNRVDNCSERRILSRPPVWMIYVIGRTDVSYFVELTGPHADPDVAGPAEDLYIYIPGNIRNPLRDVTVHLSIVDS
jgi:hypothetical protein